MMSGTGHRLRRLGTILFSLTFLLAGMLPLAPIAAASSYTYTGSYKGETVNLTRVTNQTVESFSDATQVGQLSNFQTTDPTATCLNGTSLNVWTAPSEFPGDYVVHNGAQGTQCTYVTLTFPQKQSVTLTATASPNPLPQGTATMQVSASFSQPVSDGTLSFTGGWDSSVNVSVTPSSGSGSVTLQTAQWTPGTYTINVNWSGDSQYNAASTSVSVTVSAPTCAAPTVSGISPTSGPPGTTVTITGSGFGSSAGEVQFLNYHGTPAWVKATVSAWSNTSITATVPNVNAAPGPISVDVTPACGVSAWPNDTGAVQFSVTAPSYTYACTFNGTSETLTKVTNVTVESLSDATNIGTCDNFQTNDPYYSALNGENINTWTAPSEFPGVDVVHNGDMGTQSVYGTWTFPAPTTQKQNLTLTASASPNPVTAGSSWTLTVTLSQPVNDGTVNATATGNGTTWSWNPCTPTNGVCTFPSGSSTGASGLTAGTYTVNVTWSGDSQYNAASGTTTLTVSASTAYTYTCTFNGTSETLTKVTNVTVEGLSDATNIGTCDNFQTNDPYYSALNGENINTWTAPSEFPGVDVVHNGDMGTQSVYGTWTFTPPAACTVASYSVTAPSGVTAGVRFGVRIQALDQSGNPVICATNPVYLSSSTNDVLFLNSKFSKTGPTSQTINLRNGSATVVAVDMVPESVTIEAQDQSGSTGTSGSVTVGTPASNLQLGIYSNTMTPGSFSGTPTQSIHPANIQFLDYNNGVLTSSNLGGYWPLGVGTPYSAQWTGTIYIPSPLPIWPPGFPLPQHIYRFRNVADDNGWAQLTAGTGTITLLSTGKPVSSVTIPTSSWQQGNNHGVAVRLSPGTYTVDVQQTEYDGLGGAGDILYWSQGRLVGPPPCTTKICPLYVIASILKWSPYVPVPPAAFVPHPQPLLLHGVVMTIGDPHEYLDGASVTTPIAPLIMNGRTMVPIRFVGQALGATVHWDGSKRQIVIDLEGHTIIMTVGSTSFTLDGTAETMDVAPTIVPPGYTVVPIRFISEALGGQVGWNAQTRQVIILSPTGSSPTAPVTTNKSGAPEGITEPPPPPPPPCGGNPTNC